MYCFIVTDVRVLGNKFYQCVWRVESCMDLPGSQILSRGSCFTKGDVIADELLDGLVASPHMWRASCLARRSCAAASTRASRALRPRPTPQSARALAGARRAEHRRTAWTPTSSSTSGAMSTRAVGSEASSSSSPDHATSWTGGSRTRSRRGCARTASTPGSRPRRTTRNRPLSWRPRCVWVRRLWRRFPAGRRSTRPRASAADPRRS